MITNNKNIIRMNLAKVTALFMLTTAFLFSCSGQDKDTENDNSENTQRAKPVKIAELEEKSISRKINYTSNLIPFDEVYVAPAAPGRIMKIHVEVGDRVQKGQLLIEMDPTQLNQAKIQLANLERDFQRFDSLIEFGAIPRQQYDQMKTQIEVTKENIDFLEANTSVRAPFSGIISGKYFEDGELFSAAPNTPVGKAAIVLLQRINPIKAVIAVSEKYFPEIKTGMTVDLITDIYPNKIFNGEIYRIHPTINPASKTFNVELRVNNPNELLRPGMFSRISFEFRQDPGILVQSNVVLQQIGTNERYIFLYENGHAKRVSVRIGERFDDYLEIVSENIKPGKKIIVSGHSSVLDGDKVEVVK